MPDDVKPEVTEQIGTESDETAAFSVEPEGDALEDTNLEGLDQSEKKDDVVDPDKVKKDDPDKAKAELKAKEAAEADLDKTEKPGDEEDETETDADEDVARGKEVLDAQAKEAEEAAAADAAVRAKKVDTGAYRAREMQYGDDAVEFFKGVMPPKLMPDTVTLKDGTVLDFKGVYDNDPEIPIMIAAIAKNLVDQMIDNKYLATNKDLDGINSALDNRLFLRTITNKIDGVPKAQEVYRDPKFRTWFGEQSKEIQALMRSPDPYDQIRVFKRYLNKSGLEKAGENVAGIDGKRKADKAAFDKIHKTTIKSKGRPSGSALDPRDEVIAGFTEKTKDDDDILG